MKDLKKTIIHVTQRDIEQGLPNRPSACPIAIAARRALANTSVRVFANSLTVKSDLLLLNIFKLPLAAETFITDFDAGIEVKPISFKLGNIIK